MSVVRCNGARNTSMQWKSILRSNGWAKRIIRMVHTGTSVLRFIWMTGATFCARRIASTI